MEPEKLVLEKDIKKKGDFIYHSKVMRYPASYAHPNAMRFRMTKEDGLTGEELEQFKKRGQEALPLKPGIIHGMHLKGFMNCSWCKQNKYCKEYVNGAPKETEGRWCIYETNLYLDVKRQLFEDFGVTEGEWLTHGHSVAMDMVLLARMHNYLSKKGIVQKSPIINKDGEITMTDNINVVTRDMNRIKLRVMNYFNEMLVSKKARVGEKLHLSGDFSLSALLKAVKEERQVIEVNQKEEVEEDDGDIKQLESYPEESAESESN